MKFDLKRPCPDCPFTQTCLRGWLGKSRAQEIANAVSREDKTFACHKTTAAGTGKRRQRAQESHCAGALTMIEKTGTANAMTQIAQRFGLYDPEALDLGAPVFASFEEFVAHHGAGSGR